MNSFFGPVPELGAMLQDFTGDGIAMNTIARSTRVVVTHQSRHHAAGGVVGVVQHLSGVIAVDGAESRLPYRLRRLLSRAPGSGPVYDSTSVAKELKALGIFVRNRRGLIHYLDATRDAFVMPPVAHVRRWRTLGTFHYPPAILKTKSNRRILRRLDGAIAVGSNQVDFLGSLVGTENVWVVPHGVDLDFFVPADTRSRPQRPHLVFAGQHLRDFASLEKALPPLRERFADLIVTAVVHPAYASRVPREEWIHVLSGISDDELRAVYQHASLLFLPLLDVTACTSLNEAMACGLPIVTTDVGAVHDYADDDCAVFCKREGVDELVEATTELLRASESTQLRISRASRQSALKLGWPVVATEVERVYDNIEHTSIRRKT